MIWGIYRSWGETAFSLVLCMQILSEMTKLISNFDLESIHFFVSQEISLHVCKTDFPVA